MLRKLYDAILLLAARRDAERWLALLAFIDGSLFTVPPELLQLPMSVARPSRALRYALVGTLASAGGAVLAYFIGGQLFERVAQPLLHFLGRELEFAHFADQVSGNVLLWPLAFLLAPMPAAIAAGSVHFGLAGTLLASMLGRGARFFVIGLLLKSFGQDAKRLIEAHFHRFAVVSVALLGGFVLVRYAL